MRSRPTGVEIADAGAVVDRVPASLVELALWVADYYGSTPARALALVAPFQARRRGARSEPAARDALGGEPEPAELTAEQRASVERIVAALDADGGHVLLHGPTGSGKTEVYLQAAAAALARERGVIVLVPEIALTPQTVGRFRARFGDRVAVLHSALTDAERRDERERIVAGEAPVVVGARSAIFAPVARLGLVIVDEEHDASFKQESDPRYDARTVAAKRAALEGAVAVYGSATPRVESWARLERLELPARIGAPMPTVKLVDLAARPDIRSRRRFSRSCRGRGARRARDSPPEPPRHLGRGPLPRVRHDSTLPQLRHRAHASLRLAAPLPPLRLLGRAAGVVSRVRLRRARAHRAGTQRLDAELERRLPGLERIRLDADTAARPARSARRSSASQPRSAALIGTQMVAKGHHFPGVEVAAVVDADAGLAFPDFRSEERTFQLVTQLAGRSGRDAPGRVIVQTFQPDATPFAYAVRHDVAGYLAYELARREELSYPPFHILFHSSSRDLTRATSAGRCESCEARSRPPRRASSGLRRSCASVAAIAHSCWRRQRRRGPSRAVPRRCSRAPRRPCVGTV